MDQDIKTMKGQHSSALPICIVHTSFLTRCSFWGFGRSIPTDICAADNSVDVSDPDLTFPGGLNIELGVDGLNIEEGVLPIFVALCGGPMALEFMGGAMESLPGQVIYA